MNSKKTFNSIRMLALCLVILLIFRVVTWKHVANLQLHGMFEVDTSSIKASERIKEDVPFTFFIQTRIPADQTEYRLNYYDFEIPNEVLASFDFGSNSTIILSFGREIKELTYKPSWYPRGFADHTAIVTFYEDYQNDIMFVYSMEDVYFLHPEFYVMNGSQREYWGYGGDTGGVYSEELENLPKQIV